MCPSAPNAIVLVTLLLPSWNTMSKVSINQRAEFGFWFQRVRAMVPGWKNSWECTTWSTATRQKEREREQRELHESLGSSKPIHCDTSSPTRPHLLIIPKQSTLSPSISSHTWVCGSCSNSTHNSSICT